MDKTPEKNGFNKKRSILHSCPLSEVGVRIPVFLFFLQLFSKTGFTSGTTK
jgi:hypothetical protein